MATTIEWRVNNLERETEDGFVFTVHYTVNAKNDAYSTGAYGSIGLERPETLIPFSELTEDLVISWVKEKLGEEQVASVETALETQLEEMARPTKMAGVPW